MGINRPLGGGGGGTTQQIKTYTYQYKPTHDKTSHRISTSEISLDKPHMMPTDAVKRDLALSLISSNADSRKETTPLSTT